MDKVYVLVAGQHDDISVEGIFSSRVLAEAAQKEVVLARGGAKVTEMTLDSLLGVKAVPYWRATVNVQTGELQKDVYLGYGRKWELSDRLDWLTGDSLNPMNNVDCIPFKHSGYIPSGLTAYSLVSQEDADRVALEMMDQLRHKIHFDMVEKRGSWYYPQDLTQKLYEEGKCKWPS